MGDESSHEELKGAEGEGKGEGVEEHFGGDDAQRSAYIPTHDQKKKSERAGGAFEARKELALILRAFLIHSRREK